MRILHIDETFHPDYGYHTNPLAKFQQRQGHTVFILAPTKDCLHPVYREFGDDGADLEQADAAYESETDVTIVRIPGKGWVMQRMVYGRELFQAVEQIAPDVLYIHCVETLTAMRFLLRRPRYPMLFDSHMLAMASRNPLAGLYERVYRGSFARLIREKGYEVIRTQEDDYVNTHLGIPRELTPYLSFGTDTLLFHPSMEARRAFRREHGIEERDFVVVYTGKLTEAKGGLLLAAAVQRRFEVPITLVTVGTPPDTPYGREVQSRLARSENRVLQFSTQKYGALARFYQMADLCVFPAQCSLSFFDAQACGLPVLSEANPINIERCSHGNGANFRPGDVEDLRAGILRFACMSWAERAVYAQNARAMIEDRFDYADIAAAYTAHLERAVLRFQREERKRGGASDVGNTPERANLRRA